MRIGVIYQRFDLCTHSVVHSMVYRDVLLL